MTRRFDAAALPLDRLGVIEASAGTGKTFGLASVYLRAVVERALLPDAILVVTFGVAATAELGARLRAALEAALELTRRAATLDAAEGAIAQLLRAIVPRAGGLDVARGRIEAALAGYERRVVLTIHGFCALVLREYALECGAPPRPRAAFDDALLREEAAADYWHARMGARDGDAAWFAEFSSPAKLLAQIRPLLSPGLARLLPVSIDAELDVAEETLAEHVDRARGLWNHRDSALASIADRKSGLSLSEKNYRADRVAECVEAVERFFGGGEEFPEDCLFTPSRLASGMQPREIAKGTRPPSHPLFDALGALAEAHSRVRRLRRAAWLNEAAAEIGARVRGLARTRGLISYDELVAEVHAALASPGGGALAATIARRWTIALLDECQDTDTLQYDIFRRVYVRDQSGGRDGAALVLVGDPKQAIYRFRGGDVFAYAAALDDAPEARWTLDTNYRSTSGLVAAVNAMFADDPFGLDFVHFDPVAAAGEPKTGPLVDPRRHAAFVLWDAGTPGGDAKPWTAGELERLAIDACAEEIVRLLDDGVAGAADIAVLVPTNRQVEQTVAALARRGVESSASSRQSVFATASARELHALLAALADPSDERLLRGALIGPGFELDAATLARAATEPALLASWRELFARLAQEWRRDGVLAALAALIASCAARVLEAEGGARRLADWRHVAELLASADVPLREPGAVLAWLVRRLARTSRLRGGSDVAVDEAEWRRPEPGAERVRVMTLHQSKGLQFPIVFAPLLWTAPGERDAVVVSFHDDDHAACLDLGSDRQAAHRERERAEQAAEQVRLAYVALTRAALRCYAVFGKAKGRSGIERVLFGEPGADALDAAAIRARLDAIAARGAFVVEDLPATMRITRRNVVRAMPALAAAPTPRVPPPARVWSYSSLKRLDPSPVALDARTERRLAAVDDGPADGHGARFGECFHSLLETLDPAAWPGADAHAHIARALDRFRLDAANAPALERLIGATLAAEVAPGVRLRELDRASCARELPLLFALDRVDPRALAHELATEPAHAHLAALLERAPAALDGLMRGYVDLAFAHAGRHWLLDYKTDTLHGDDAYAPAALALAVRERGYDLQYLIYAVALRRWLRVRAGAERMPGPGVVYLFVRGLAAGEGRGVFRAQPPEPLLDRLENVLMRGAA